MHGMGNEHGWHWLGGPGMILIWLLIIIGMIALVRWLTGKKHSTQKGGSGDGALDILKKRYAKGEISREEYEQMRDDLDKNR